MANIYTRNPIYVDTIFQSYKAQVASTLGTLLHLIVTKIRWVGPAAVGDTVVFDDPQSGNQLLLMRNPTLAGADIEADFSASPRLWADFGVPQLSSGKLYIFMK